jgi:hypothetical protein
VPGFAGRSLLRASCDPATVIRTLASPYLACSRRPAREVARHGGQHPALADLHPHLERGTSAYVWHLFDRLDDLRPLPRP